MNSIKSLVCKFAFLMVALLSVNFASAEESIVANLAIPDTKITSEDQTALVSICLNDENEDVAALQFRFLLPPELEFADGEDTEPIPNTERLINNNHVIALNTTTGMVVLQSLNLQNIKGKSGEIMQIPVKVKAGQLESGKTVNIAISMIEFSSGNGQNTGHQANFDAHVLLEPFTYKAYLEPTELTAFPGVAKTMSFCLENIYTGTEEAAPLLGFTINVDLPEGFEIDPNSINKNADRLFTRTIVTYENGMFWLSDVSQNRPLKSGISDGPLFTFDVKAPADYVAGDKDAITFSEFKVSAVLDAFAVQGENATWVDCAIVDGVAINQAAYDEVLATIQALENSYTDAVAEIEESNPDFDLTEWKEIIGNAIQEAKTGAQQAFEAANEDGEVFTFAFAGEDIENMIAEMKAKAALAANNEAAYEEVLAAINAVETKYQEAVAAIEENYPDYDLTEWKEIIENAINEAKSGAEQALAAATEDGEEYTFAFSAEDIENMIAEMEAGAAREAANQTAYEEVLAAIDAVEKKYQEAVAAIEENYPDYDLTEWKEIIENAINEAKSGAEQALAAATEDGEEYAFAFSAEEIENMIAEMEAGAAREAANQAAYEEVLAAIDAVENHYLDAVAELEENYPDVDLTEWKEIIGNAINEARTGAEQALATANEEGEEYSFEFDGSDIEAMITEMIKDTETSSISAIEADVQAGNATIYTLDGRMHTTIVRGAVNIITRGNTTTKMYIRK